uniref:Uncharacterized protein n=1 Tax=Arundo donax TaxID=35708 RepID=A0A0A9FZG3_ARUDO
MGSSPAKQ